MNVKAWRKARALTQEQASTLLGLSWRQYQRVEAGHSKLSGSVARIMELMK